MHTVYQCTSSGLATIPPERQYSFCSAIFGPTNYHFRMGWNQEQLLGIESIVSGVPDAHEAFHHIDVDVDGLYSAIRVPVLQELQAFIQNHA